MALNSFSYLLVFLPLVAAGAYALRSRWGLDAARGWLLLASAAFYVSEGLVSAAVLIGSITANWMVGSALSRTDSPIRSRKGLLVGALVANIGVLCVFKYATAATALLEAALGRDLAVPNLGFPLGLSFFTITQVMYLVDSYERLAPPRRWLDHATFVAFFPNITAGPLLRSRLFFAQLPGLARRDGLDVRLSAAAGLIALGLLKKSVLGDSFAQVARAGYARIDALTTGEAWVTTLAGTFEIYFDFSGYSDIALGSAAILGLTLARNFDTPFISATISEFWKRWHISLSEFITTYLYTPILRSMGKATLAKSAGATVLAMLIAGIWHGATWNYVLFGLMHGLALGGYQYWKKWKRPLPRPLAIVATFLFVHLTFILVLAPDFGAAARLALKLVPGESLLGLDTLLAAIPASDLRMMALPLLIGCVVAFVGPTAERLAAKFQPSLRADLVTITALLVAYAFTHAREITEFRYRQF